MLSKVVSNDFYTIFSKYLNSFVVKSDRLDLLNVICFKLVLRKYIKTLQKIWLSDKPPTNDSKSTISGNNIRQIHLHVIFLRIHLHGLQIRNVARRDISPLQILSFTILRILVRNVVCHMTETLCVCVVRYLKIKTTNNVLNDFKFQKITF